MRKIYCSLLLLLCTAGLVRAQNVGVGTNDPKSKLDIKGGVTIGSSYSGVNAAPADGAIIQGPVGIGTATPNAKAALDISSVNKGLYIPRLTNAQAAALGATLNASNKGLLIFNTDNNQTEFWDGSQWKAVGAGVGGPPTGAAGGDLSGTYPNPTINNDAVNSAKILDNSITGNDIQNNTIDLTTKVNNVLPVQNGGTGVNTVSGIMQGNGSSPVTGIAATGALQYLRRNASNTAYEFGQINYTDLSGTPASLPPSGPASGDLNGNYPSPTVDGLQGYPVSSTNPAAGEVLKWNGSAWAPAPDNNTGTLSGSGTTNYIPKWTGATTLSSTSNIYDNGTNVGIGPSFTAPQHPLSVGAATSDVQLVAVRGYSNTPQNWKGGAAFGYTSASVIMGELSGVAQLAGHTSTLNNWANLAINSGGGNVGIGTTNPLGKLSIGGGSLVDNNLLVQISTGGAGSESYYAANKNGGYGLLIGYANGAGLGTKALIRNVTTDPLSFYVNNTTEAMTILSSGNVGIGTSPGVKLDVAGTTAVDYLRVDPQDGVNEGGEIQLVGAGTNGTFQIDNYAGNARIHTLGSGKIFEVVGGNGIKATGGQLTTLAGSGNRMVMADASGNLKTNTTITKTDVIYVRGTGLNHNANRVVRIGSTEYVNSSGRGLTLTIVDKATHNVVSNTNYDTYGDPNASNALATALDGVNNGQIGILTSYDAWEGNITSNLQAAFARVGLYKAAATTVGGSRRPYAAIFEASSSASVPSASAAEIEHGPDVEEPYAELRGWLIDGGYVATTQVNSGLSTPTGKPAAIINENKELVLPNLSGSGDRPLYADANGVVHPGTNYGNLDIATVGDSRVTFAGTWNTGTGAWGINRLSNSYAYNSCSGSTTSCTLDYIVLSLDNNTYKSVYVSDLDWSNCGAAAVYLSYDGGATYNFSSLFSTFRNIDLTGSPYTSTIRCIADNLPLGSNIRVKVVAERGRFHFEGFGLSHEVNGQEGLSTIFPHAYNLLNDFSGFPSGTYYFTSQGGDLMLNVSGSGYAPGAQAIGVDIYVDGTWRGRARGFTNEAYSHKVFTSNFVVVRDLAAGLHYLTFGNYNGSIYDSNDPFNASVIELPPY